MKGSTSYDLPQVNAKHVLEKYKIRCLLIDAYGVYHPGWSRSVIRASIRRHCRKVVNLCCLQIPVENVKKRVPKGQGTAGGITCLKIKNCVRHEHVTYLVSSYSPTHGEHVEYLF